MPNLTGVLKVRFDDWSERRLLYIVHACAVKGVMFKNTKPLRSAPRREAARP